MIEEASLQATSQANSDQCAALNKVRGNVGCLRICSSHHDLIDNGIEVKGGDDSKGTR